MIVYELPLPPSTNNLFGTGIGKKRYVSAKYNEWRQNADRFLLAQGRLQVMAGQVAIRITIRDTSRGDLDNRIKPVLDFLVHHGIIEDDNINIVRSLTIEAGDVTGARVEISRPDNAVWIIRRDIGRKREGVA